MPGTKQSGGVGNEGAGRAAPELREVQAEAEAGRRAPTATGKGHVVEALPQAGRLGLGRVTSVQTCPQVMRRRGKPR